VNSWKLDVETKVRYDVETGAPTKSMNYWIKEEPVSPYNIVALLSESSEQDAIKNGRLMAAAPEMYSILEDIVEGGFASETEYDGRAEYYCHFCGAYQERVSEATHNNGCSFLSAEAILKKARGES